MVVSFFGDDFISWCFGVLLWFVPFMVHVLVFLCVCSFRGSCVGMLVCCCVFVHLMVQMLVFLCVVVFLLLIVSFEGWVWAGGFDLPLKV